MTTWDDHDYGANDAGGAFAYKEWAEKIYETYWSSSDEVGGASGSSVESRIVGLAVLRVQFIILDLRFFRSDLAVMPYRDPGPALGWYIPNIGISIDFGQRPPELASTRRTIQTWPNYVSSSRQRRSLPTHIISKDGSDFPKERDRSMPCWPTKKSATPSSLRATVIQAHSIKPSFRGFRSLYGISRPKLAQLCVRQRALALNWS